MIKLYTSSLRSKILLGFAIILLIMFFASLWSIYNFYLLNESIKSTMQQNYTSITAADNMSKSLDDQLEALILFFNQDFEYGEKLYQKSKEDFFFWYGKARQSAFTEREKSILDSLNAEYNYFLKSFGNIPDIKHSRFPGEIPSYNFLIIADEIKNLKKKSNEIVGINHNLLNVAVSSTKEITQTATIFIVVILVGAIAVSVLFGTQFANYVVRPITELRKSVEHVAEGHFDERIDIEESSDEIDGLALEFNKMSERLAGYEQLNLNKILFEKKKSELTIESMNEPVLMVDKEYNVLLSNRTFNETFGDKYFNESSIQKLVTAPASSTGNIYMDHDIITLKKNSGAQKIFKVISASLEIPESDLTGTVIVFNDITKYKELDRMKSEFIAKVSHELKTPLTSLGMALGIIEDGVVGKLTGKQGELVSSMKEDYERLNKLVYEILELAKLEASADKIKFEKIPASKLADHVAKKFEILALEKNIKMEIIDNGKEALINCSYSNILSAIENLVSNSLRFTPPNGKIKYCQSVVNGCLLIEISDTGIGISPEDIKLIFDKFIQIDDSSPGSLGLGLSIAKEVIEIHNGEIKAFSDLGKGSTFQIKLPVA